MVQKKERRFTLRLTLKEYHQMIAIANQREVRPSELIRQLLSKAAVLKKRRR